MYMWGEVGETGASNYCVVRRGTLIASPLLVLPKDHFFFAILMNNSQEGFFFAVKAQAQNHSVAATFVLKDKNRGFITARQAVQKAKIGAVIEQAGEGQSLFACSGINASLNAELSVVCP